MRRVERERAPSHGSGRHTLHSQAHSICNCCTANKLSHSERVAPSAACPLLVGTFARLRFAIRESRRHCSLWRAALLRHCRRPEITATQSVSPGQQQQRLRRHHKSFPRSPPSACSACSRSRPATAARNVFKSLETVAKFAMRTDAGSKRGSSPARLLRGMSALAARFYR